MRINKKYSYKTTPVANEKSVVQGDKYRFTILTSRLIRIEYNENGHFEDRATQTVVNRLFDAVPFTVNETAQFLTITTQHIELKYTKQPFSQNSLSVRYTGKNSSVKAGKISTYWYFDTEADFDLKGTARTLDDIDGACKLESGIISKGPITMLDDSNSLIICEDGWIETRKEKGVDAYLFCYGDCDKKFDAKACLKDFYALTGKTPLLPRYTLGNWWSRYHAYTQEEYTDLMKKFKKEDIPFSVAVIDMDWHYVNIDPKYGTGWTGYTWDKNLFPNHKEFLDFLHNEGLEVSLNLHPQEGVAAHEDAYKEMAKAMGIDPESEDPVPFEIENPKFLENYFTHLHHPLEKEGVTFWWMDWQQGNTTSVQGLDPLWMLNHFHYVDNEKSGKRGLFFSRYSGPGSHRYPIGFSGDTHITWESLDFQPYFTATASNIGYGWWSHDIGGHMKGYRDEELITRWFQLGTFSPLNRLHSSCSKFQGKEPWKYNKISEISMKKFLKLRHELIPYLYTMNYHAHAFDEPIVQPLYYNWSVNEAYEMKNEYTFGSEMLISPITSACDDETKMGSVKTYLPEGVWYDFFNGLRYTGGRTVTMYRDMYEMPVLVRAGGIIPMANLQHINDIENPENMKVKVFAGADNSFELYEDDGTTYEYKNGAYAITKMIFNWNETAEFIISSPTGNTSVIPSERDFDIEFVGVNTCSNIMVTENGKEKDFTKQITENTITISVKNVSGEVNILLKNAKEAANNTLERLYPIIEKLEKIPNDMKKVIQDIIESNIPSCKMISDLSQLDISKNVFLALTEIISAEIQ